mgnify:CR=1 FL=1
MKRVNKAMSIFIEFWRKENREPTRKEFNETWQGDACYYYRLRKQFRENFDELVMGGTDQ